MQTKVFAKLNMFLNVFGKEGDFHPLESLFLPCYDLADTVNIDFCGGNGEVEFALETPKNVWMNSAFKQKMLRQISELSQMEDNSGKALRLFFQSIGKAGEEKNCKITISKSIPFLGGLGGSSADGVGVLRLACEKFGLSEGDIATLRDTIGSDLCGMWNGKVNLCKGRGNAREVIAEGIGKFAVICMSDFSLSTKDVFFQFDKLPPQEPYEILADEDFSKEFGKMSNHLEKPAFIICPRAKIFKGELQKLSGKKFQMTGSGGAFFSILETKAQAEFVAEQIKPACNWLAVSRV